MGYDFVFIHQIRKIFAIISYHYQNQTDKPEGISKAAWDKRCRDWDDVIDPDYIPAHNDCSPLRQSEMLAFSSNHYRQ